MKYNLNEEYEKIINESVFLEDFYTILKDRNGTVIFYNKLPEIKKYDDLRDLLNTNDILYGRCFRVEQLSSNIDYLKKYKLYITGDKYEEYINGFEYIVVKITTEQEIDKDTVTDSIKYQDK